MNIDADPSGMNSYAVTVRIPGQDSNHGARMRLLMVELLGMLSAADDDGERNGDTDAGSVTRLMSRAG